MAKTLVSNVFYNISIAFQNICSFTYLYFKMCIVQIICFYNLHFISKHLNVVFALLATATNVRHVRSRLVPLRERFAVDPFLLQVVLTAVLARVADVPPALEVRRRVHLVGPKPEANKHLAENPRDAHAPINALLAEDPDHPCLVPVCVPLQIQLVRTLRSPQDTVDAVLSGHNRLEEVRVLATVALRASRVMEGPGVHQLVWFPHPASVRLHEGVGDLVLRPLRVDPHAAVQSDPLEAEGDEEDGKEGLLYWWCRGRRRL